MTEDRPQLPLSRDEAMKWQAARSRLLAPTEKELALDRALLEVHRFNQAMQEGNR